MSTNARRQAEGLGRGGERVAAWMLRLKGYQILAVRYKTPVGELDLVARRGNLLAIVEVKARASIDDALAAISARQRRRIEQAAGAFLARHPAWNGCDVRFDVIAVSAWRWPCHIIDAWRPHV